MRKTLFLIAAGFIIVLAWFGVWSALMASDVARVRASIEFQNQRLRVVNRTMELRADSVSAVGFPFRFRVGVTRATLSMVEGKETFVVSIPELYMQSLDSEQGSYRVVIPPTFDAMYAIDGAAPESYVVTADPMPALQLRAQGDSTKCSIFPGAARCAAVAADAPLISYAVQVPQTLTLHMQLAGEKRDAAFTMMAFDVPLFQDIPADMARPLQLLVGVLREALVFKTGDKSL